MPPSHGLYYTVYGCYFMRTLLLDYVIGLAYTTLYILNTHGLYSVQTSHVGYVIDRVCSFSYIHVRWCSSIGKTGLFRYALWHHWCWDIYCISSFPDLQGTMTSTLNVMVIIITVWMLICMSCTQEFKLNISFYVDVSNFFIPREYCSFCMYYVDIRQEH